MFIKLKIQHDTLKLEGATRQGAGQLAATTRHGYRRFTEAALRLLFLSLPMRRIPLIQRLSKRHQNRHPTAKHNSLALNKPFQAAISDNKRENARKSPHRLAALQKFQKQDMALYQNRLALLYQVPGFKG